MNRHGAAVRTQGFTSQYPNRVIVGKLHCLFTFISSILKINVYLFSDSHTMFYEAHVRDIVDMKDERIQK